MGSSRVLFCSTALVLVLLSSASHDEQQRDITFDPDRIMQEELPDSLLMQRELDLSELFELDDFFGGQVMVSSPKRENDQEFRPGVLTPRGSRPGFQPRSFGGPPLLDYPVQFPLARPSSNNLHAICLHGEHRPRYPDSYFPASGFGQQKRRASAINNAESWFSMCCKGNQTWGREVTLCCATQAWELSVQSFCEEDSSVKDRLYHCCRQTGSDRLNCFNSDSKNPNYAPTEDLPVQLLPSTVSFSFDPNTCQRPVITPYSIRGIRRHKVKKTSTPKKVDINFPPGRPTADSVESLCRNQRPLYAVKCLPGSGYELVARQAKTINRLEKGFKRCCKKKGQVLDCTDQKWREELDKFCLGENGEPVDFSCCSVALEANDRYSCFHNISSDPHYNRTSATEEPSLDKICETPQIINKKSPYGLTLRGFVQQCCPLSDQDRSKCAEQMLNDMVQRECLSRKISPSLRRCCRTSTPECVSKILKSVFVKGTSVGRPKKKKRCPLS